ncbi:FecR family protein [Reyranella sp.]|uniref:FecR family protein n=1 Tax=Reyranella sp. TaxID=1929291 RepID=UPI003D107C32
MRFEKLAAVLLAFAAVLTNAPALSQSIGITSAATGEPLGKPPAKEERVLRVGFDLQAGELVTTGAEDRAHLLFLDGTALTVGPQARLTLDRFVYDNDRRLGALSLTAAQGVFRLVGGRISKTVPITVNTPSGTIGIRGGIVLLKVEPTETTATFLFGYQMTMTSRGQTQTVTTPGWRVSSLAGQSPSAPALAPRGAFSEQMRLLEGPGGRPPNGMVDRAAQKSGFADRNSGRGPDFRGPVQGGSALRNGDRSGPRTMNEPFSRMLPPGMGDTPRLPSTTVP